MAVSPQEPEENYGPLSGTTWVWSRAVRPQCCATVAVRSRRRPCSSLPCARTDDGGHGEYNSSPCTNAARTMGPWGAEVSRIMAARTTSGPRAPWARAAGSLVRSNGPARAQPTSMRDRHGERTANTEGGTTRGLPARRPARRAGYRRGGRPSEDGSLHRGSIGVLWACGGSTSAWEYCCKRRRQVRICLPHISSLATNCP
jgi:hypothetical protein